VWFLRTDVSEENFASIIGMKRVSELGTNVSSNYYLKDAQEPHGATFQKRESFIVTVMKTSNLAISALICSNYRIFWNSVFHIKELELLFKLFMKKLYRYILFYK
jgi:hypothetical protein